MHNNDRLEVLLKGDTNGVKALETTRDRKVEIYRLDGRRIEGKELLNGVYIINGKKVLVNNR